MRKSHALLTIPAQHLTHSIEVRFVPQAFPMRATHPLTCSLDGFLQPSVGANPYSNIHGPGSLLRRQQIGLDAQGEAALVKATPALARTPAEVQPVREQSAKRAHNPSVAGLLSAASGKPSPPSAVVMATTGAPATYTTDQLAARTPRNGPHAMAGPDADYWIKAMLVDFAIIRDNKCIINVTEVRPPGPAPPPVEQRFKFKHRSASAVALEDMEPSEFKARTVVRGDRFRYGEHYDETAAPVVHVPALKMLIAWAVQLGLFLYQWDVGAAFYGNPMDRPGVIVQLPPGYDPYSNAIRPLHLPKLYGELAGALPGIPQGSLLHYKSLAPQLAKLGFNPLQADNCVFLHTKQQMATSLWVDDGVLACPSLAHAEQVLGPAGLGGMRKITWGPLKNTLGIDFSVSYNAARRVVFMNQRVFATTILERAGMLDCNPTRTPASASRVYTKADCPATDEEKAELKRRGFSQEKYHTIQASINFYVTITRDDLRFINGKLCRYNTNPGEEHYKGQKQQLRFIKGTLDHGIEFKWTQAADPPSDGPLTITAWSDSSFADDKDTGRTTLGFVIKVNGATITSSSKLGTRVDSCVNHSELNAFQSAAGADNATEAAIGQLTDGASTALVKTARTVAWVRGVKAGLERRTVASMPPTPVLVDNSGVIAMLKDTTLKSANKHIYKELQECRERVHLDKAVVAVKVDTKDNIANAMTKQEPGVDGSANQLRIITGPCSITFTN